MVQFPGGPTGLTPSSQQVSEWIRDRIRRGQFVPDQRLVEVDIIRSTGSSRVRVREALQRLAAEGLVTIEPYRGASVRSISIDELRHIYRARVALEGTAAADFATNASDGQRERLQQVQDALEQCIVDRAPERFGKLNSEWHGLLVEGSGNTIIGELLQRLSVPIHRLLFESFYDADRLRTANDDHRRILKAIMARDPDAAEREMRAHVDAGFRTLSAIERDYQV
ncbi:GntR family transcriptional regulator [Sphingomonas piscis]|uniref:GntR family transcriptional regulator n=1 Tax=Sphingomonas piscis TaxID=2714943 RepID=A0A6G7YM48_9SPHN|nr:GntR family transcriptional regulator [Sphingomonas piscis]QIK77812.1 GntR family transcriptional regulator [Sphingomonas piscis]